MTNDPTPLQQMNPLERFSGLAEDYAKYRPSYPAEAIATLLSDLGEPTQLVAADIGAGTGIASRLLAERGVRVWAIEPNGDMQRAAEPHPGITFQSGNAEQTHLPDRSVDLVTCFQSFHWFDHAQCLPEFHRILKPTGRLAVVWNDRDRSDELTQGYSDLICHLSNRHPAEQRLVAQQPLKSSSAFHNLREHIFRYQQALDLTGLIGRAQSVSYLPKDKATQQQLFDGMKELYDRWADQKGFVYLTYRTQVFLTDPK
ncbi:class I SAM-dependent methyltransferase [Kovacikia minuta CCNUW1]|uniref:class I SAM-dependent methyltransferase n=1 Tax=Kovacikia minuta TaxID=2931930 RepID=UPI001CCC5640|nr:class I SAM-dependent methyltransferase [Kovacikia minuta]UBF26071.1 class I SAM-dependent methyltransferase [Kovacikia minuta CCNUW1]